MTTLPNGVRFHSDHYRKIVKARLESDKRDKLYCFAKRKEMGKNGKLDSHPMYGRQYERNGKVYTVDSVNIHFLDGEYYWFVVFVDENGSSAPRMYRNINSTTEWVLESIADTYKEFRLISTKPNSQTH